MIKYLVVDATDAYAVSVSPYEGEDAMLEAVQYKEIDDLDVYEVNKKIRLEKRPSIILSDEQ